MKKELLEYAKERQTENDKGYVKQDVLYLHKVKYVYNESWIRGCDLTDKDERKARCYRSLSSTAVA